MTGFSVQRFTGQYCDPVIGGYPLGNGYRTYQPGLMRFSAPDTASPFGAGGVNPYVYCGADPINRIDPTGHFFLLTWLRDIAKTVFSPEKDPLVNFIKQEAVAIVTSLPVAAIDPIGAVLGVATATVSNVAVAAGDNAFANDFNKISMFGLAGLDPPLEFVRGATATVERVGEEEAENVLGSAERGGQMAGSGAGRAEEGAADTAAQSTETAESTASRTSHQEDPSQPPPPQWNWGAGAKAALKSALAQGAGIGIYEISQKNPELGQEIAGGMVVASAISLGSMVTRGARKLLAPPEDMYSSPTQRRATDSAQQRLVDRSRARG